MNTTKQEIERMVNKYPYPNSKELFRTELEYLVGIAQREQMVEDHENVMKTIKDEN